MTNKVITIKLPKLTTYQQLPWDYLKDSRGSGKICVIKSIRQSGKSFFCCMLLIKFAFEKPCVSVIYEPTLTQSREMYKHLLNYFKGSDYIKSSNASLLEIEFTNGSRILFKSTEQSSRGFTVSGVLILDECAYLREDEINVILPTTNVYNAPIVCVSTPAFEDGYFYDVYNQGIIKINNVVTFDWAAHPDVERFLSPERKEYYRQTMTKLKYQTEVLGQFISEGSYIFGDIKKCIKHSNKQPKYAGIDWATGNNGDYTWLTLMDEDKNVTSIHYFNDNTPDEQIELIANILKPLKLEKITVEQNSIGEIYFAYLKKALPNHNILKFSTTNDSKRRIIDKLVHAFQESAIGIPDDKELYVQLQHYQIEQTKGGKVTYNAQAGFHDDGVMSLAIVYDSITGNAGTYRLSSKKHRI